jgi:hypothetical protein
MRRRKHLSIPQHEFGFAVETFNLIQETGLDGARIAREQAEIANAREEAKAAQGQILAITSSKKPVFTVSKNVSKVF